MRRSNPQVSIAKIDYTANEVALVGASIKSYPTIYLFKSGKKNKPVLYTGSRELLALSSFVEDNSEPANFIRSEL